MPDEPFPIFAPGTDLGDISDAAERLTDAMLANDLNGAAKQPIPPGVLQALIDTYNGIIAWVAANPLVGQGTDPNTPGD